MELSRTLQEYEEAFDFYIDQGRLPDNIPQGDLLGMFISRTIADNPQLESQDPLWLEILKDEMMKFIEAMLQLFRPIEQNYQQEKGFVRLFAEAAESQKRQMWDEVYQLVKGKYKAEEVNIDGYLEQLNTEDHEAVYTSMVKDWNRACDNQLERQRRALLELNKPYWQKGVRDHSMADFEQHKKIEQIVYSYPALVEIIQIIGREQPKREDELDDTVRNYLPLLPSPPRPAIEIDEVSSGNDLQHMLPIETAILADHQTEDVFYLKYATQKLQLFANRIKEHGQEKQEQIQQLKPRLEKGPIIVSLDTSGSMSGRPIQLAKSLLLQLLRMAKKQKRKCFLITFSVRAKCLDLSRPGSWRKLDAFLDETFCGGTDGEEMLDAALKMLYSADYAMADVLIISDFEFNLPTPSTSESMRIEHRRGTRFYGLQIGKMKNPYNDILDKIWIV